MKTLDINSSRTINLKELKSLYPDAANYLFTRNRFNWQPTDELNIEEFKNIINSNTLATEFLNQLQTKVIVF